MTAIERRVIAKFIKADKLLNDQATFDKALDLLNDILEENPDFGRAHNHIGWIYKNKLSDFKMAEEHYKLAIQLAPDYIHGYRNYAILLSDQGRYNELKDILNKSMELPGINRGSVHNEYGIMYEMLEEYDKAIDAYEMAIKYYTNNQDIDVAVKNIERCERKKEMFNLNY